MSSVGFVIITDIRCVGTTDSATPFVKDSAESLSRQGQGIGYPSGSTPHWAISIAFTDKKGPHSQPSV
jgi:hypothetical protein